MRNSAPPVEECPPEAPRPEEANQAWQDLDGEIAVKREIIRAVADIRLKPAA
jgi:hypothetical protein